MYTNILPFFRDLILFQLGIITHGKIPSLAIPALVLYITASSLR